jgi:peroxiredoxin
MPALERGKHAPDIQLPTMDGGNFFLAHAMYQGPVVAVFFKISCPVCQFALPYMERIHQAAKGKNVTVIGISQNTKKDTEFFARQYGITFPIALDNPKNYAVSNAYGLTNVPTVFYIALGGTIEISSVGWSKSDVEAIARRVSEQIKIPSIPVIAAGEDVPAFRGG